MPDHLHTEKVSVIYPRLPGDPVVRRFWIAYPDYVLCYGHVSDRIARAWGRGRTQKKAVRAAKAHTSQGHSALTLH